MCDSGSFTPVLTDMKAEWFLFLPSREKTLEDSGRWAMCLRSKFKEITLEKKSYLSFQYLSGSWHSAN